FRYRMLSDPMKAFVWLCVIGVVNVGFEALLSSMRITNYLMSDFYLLAAVPFFGLIYAATVPPGRVRSTLRAGSAMFVVLWLVDELIAGNMHVMNSLLSMAAAIFLVIMSVITFNAMLRSSTSSLSSKPMFWVLTGTIVYYAGTFAVMGMGSNLLAVDLHVFVVTWYVNWSLVIVSMLMYAKGFLCTSQA
ncbi:MAG TPA: hypothetical protein VMH23_03080, partial [Bacteroidota bacterium]|nr:hypothetical protein [Bacteroidota bacterium]